MKRKYEKEEEEEEEEHLLKLPRLLPPVCLKRKSLSNIDLPTKRYKYISNKRRLKDEQLIHESCKKQCNNVQLTPHLLELHYCGIFGYGYRPIHTIPNYTQHNLQSNPIIIDESPTLLTNNLTVNTIV